MRYLSLIFIIGLVGCEAISSPPDPAEPQFRMADRLVWSEAPTLIVNGLEALTDYTLVTERRSQWGNAVERSELAFRSHDQGRIDTSTMAPVDRDIVDPYEPIRSMSYLRGETLSDLDDHQIRFRLIDSEGMLIAEQVAGIGPDRNDVVEAPLGADFPGAYVLRRSDQSGPAPTIVVLGGSEGGDSGSRSLAPIFAAEGFTVLGLPYYSPGWSGQAQFPELPQAFADIPVDYLEDAVETLRTRPDVDADRILLSGGSKGAEFVLLAGSLIPDDSPGGGFCAIVADVPSDVVWEGWGAGTESGTVSSFSWRGERLPFVPYQEIGRALDRSDPYTMTDAHVNGRDANPDRVAAARIKVEEIDEPVLLIGGMKDTTWNSGEMARNILQRRDSAGRVTEGYIYEEGGHGVGGSPLVRTSRANLDARKESFPATIAFLKRHAQRTDCRD